MSLMAPGQPSHTRNVWLHSSPPGQNGRHFADDVFKCIFMNEKFHISVQISLKFISEDPIDNNPALV